MKKEEKGKLVADLNGRLGKAKGAFIVDYKGLNVEAINTLRGELRKTDTEFEVVKNRLLKLASENTDAAIMQDHMRGPSAIAVTYDDVVAPAKALVAFSKDNDKLEIKCGQIAGKLIDLQGIKKLAELPGRDILLAQTLSAMQAVPASFVRVLNGVIANFMNVLKAIEREKAE
jgi:large subunit ribosomal protein L10